jgi:hypothetical protein
VNSPSTSPRRKVQAYQVRSPRPTDALQPALRDAYPRNEGLPEDMAAMLRHLHLYN